MDQGRRRPVTPTRGERSLHMSRLWLCLICAAFLAAAQDPVPQLAVVARWSDLLAQPVQDLGGGVRVRLGLEATAGGGGDSVLIYCLAEGFRPPATGEDEGHLGPVRVVVVNNGHRNLGASLWEGQDAVPRPGLPLYAFPVILPATGACQVTVNDAAGRALGHATIAAQAGVTSPWSPFGRSTAAQELRELAADDPGDTLFTVVGFRGTMPAVPICTGREPLAWRVPGEVDQLLPTLHPITPTDLLRLSWDGRQLIVDAGVPLDICGGDLPFLMRWWINDLPWTPPGSEGLAQNGGIVITTNSLRLEVEFSPAALGAKPTDRLAVQLLFCPDGWRPVGEQLQDLLRQRSVSRPGLMLSNRVEFRLP